ncbi:MAG: glutamine--fructose-6-phosphate transaminase (isomerizing) [Oscillospiraceae bacterium]|nr:glutamine--fructose-6-phosphate transaminase (isomerizing) [Oscillospiraceae bacterium]
MCGIVGYIGTKNASDILIEGLRKLEYRGYDSAGIVVVEGGSVVLRKTKGRLDDLEAFMVNSGRPCGNCGIGHTRWATHGEPSDINSHPHACGRVTLVHNGIIENYMQLKKELSDMGYEFKSQTDTETVAVLLESIYDGEPIKAIDELVRKIRGSYALAVIFADRPETIYAIRKDSPLIVGLSESENFIASDIPAILSLTRKYYLMEENEIAIVTKDEVKIVDREGAPIKKSVFEANWDIEAAEKGGYPHFMIKEIYEEPRVLRDTISPHIVDGLPNLNVDVLSDERIGGFKKIHIVACGTAMHAGLIGKTAIEALARIPVEVSIASEFRYANPILDKDDLVVIISQSGETADTLAALRLARQNGVFTLAVVNVVGSSIAREADAAIFTAAGPEIAVASTKAYSVQCAVMYLLALRFALVNGCDKATIAEKTATLVKMPEVVEKTIEYLDPLCKQLANENLDTQDLFFIGRGMDYSLSMEASLKLKEISYIHSEAYAAGELKHGTISLVTDGVPVVGFATQPKLLEKMISNVKEVKARGAKVFLVTSEGIEVSEDVYDFLISLPKTDELFTPLLLAPFIQLFAYHTSVARGCDVDKPRNLAKSVTVE